MSNEREISPLIEQIICRTISLLSERDEFDQETLEHLEQLLRSNDAANSDRVVDVLSAQEENTS